MKIKILMIVSILSLGACNNLERLLNGKDDESIPVSEVFGGTDPIDQAPNFGIETPEGYTREDYFGNLPIDGQIQITPMAGEVLRVFIKEKSINQWFIVPPTYSSAFWYVYDPKTGFVQYQGKHLENKGFAIYQYIPIQLEKKDL